MPHSITILRGSGGSGGDLLWTAPHSVVGRFRGTTCPRVLPWGPERLTTRSLTRRHQGRSGRLPPPVSLRVCPPPPSHQYSAGGAAPSACMIVFCAGNKIGCGCLQVELQLLRVQPPEPSPAPDSWCWAETGGGAGVGWGARAHNCTSIPEEFWSDGKPANGPVCSDGTRFRSDDIIPSSFYDVRKQGKHRPALGNLLPWSSCNNNCGSGDE